jgi:hypothetical protein
MDRTDGTKLTVLEKELGGRAGCMLVSMRVSANKTERRNPGYHEWSD